MEKFLKDKQHYIDLYDRFTVNQCRTTEQLFKDKELPTYEGKKFNKEETARLNAHFVKLTLYFETGERYLNKEKSIREWMEADQKKDEFYESAQAPENIRCLTCRNVMNPTFKDFWSGIDKQPYRVLFMYDCPNHCLPRRAFFSDGQEWRVEPKLCPH